MNSEPAQHFTPLPAKDAQAHPRIPHQRSSMARMPMLPLPTIASPKQRLFAYLIDLGTQAAFSAIGVLLSMGFGFVLITLIASEEDFNAPHKWALGGAALGVTIAILLENKAMARTGQSRGKKKIGIRVVSQDGMPLLRRNARKRALSRILGIAIGVQAGAGLLGALASGLIITAFDSCFLLFTHNRRTLSDQLCGTIVVVDDHALVNFERAVQGDDYQEAPAGDPRQASQPRVTTPGFDAARDATRRFEEAQEKAELTNAFHPATFKQRFRAFLLDLTAQGIILSIIALSASTVLLALYLLEKNTTNDLASVIFIWMGVQTVFIAAMAVLLYETMFVNGNGQTFGKKKVGIRLARKDGSPITPTFMRSRASWRFLPLTVILYLGVTQEAWALLAIPAISVIWSLKSSRHQTLRDKFTGALVVFDDSSEAGADTLRSASGENLTSGMIAPIHLRIKAGLVDGLISTSIFLTMAVFGVLSFIITSKHHGSTLGMPFFLLSGIFFAAAIMTPAAYEWLPLRHGKQTYGKTKYGIKVVDYNGQALGRRTRDNRVSARLFFMGASLLILFLGPLDLLCALRDEYNQTFHDKVARTLVVME